MNNQFIQIKKKGNKLFPKTLVIGVDVNNILASGDLTTNQTYQATEDCYIYAPNRQNISEGRYADLKIDNVLIQGHDNTNDTLIPLKKGQVVSVDRQAYTLKYTIYGLKYI